MKSFKGIVDTAPALDKLMLTDKRTHPLQLDLCQCFPYHIEWQEEIWTKQVVQGQQEKTAS